MSTLRIYAPEGSLGTPPASLAPSPPLLAGQRIGLLDNGKPGAARLLTTLAARIAERTGARAVGLRAKGSAATPAEAPLLADLEANADLILTGTAD